MDLHEDSIASGCYRRSGQCRRQKTVAQVIFRFAQQVGMLPLTGTTDVSHMKEDLDSLTFQLAEDEVRLIEALGAR